MNSKPITQHKQDKRTTTENEKIKKNMRKYNQIN